MARMSRKALEKKVELLEKAVFNLATMHNTIPSELAKPLAFGQRMPHPKALVAQNPVKTSYGWVGIEELAKFVVDGEPLKFKMEDKELVKEVYPDGSVLDVVKEKKKEKKSSYVAPKTVPYYVFRETDNGEKYLKQIDSMYAKIKKEYGW